MCPAIVSPSSALEWIASQSGRALAAPPADEATWSRRLIEACAWLSMEPLFRLAEQMQDLGEDSPDLSDAEAGVLLSLAVRSPDNPLAVNPSLEIQTKSQSAHLSLGSPASRLGLPLFLAEAMENGVLLRASPAHADGMFFLPAHQPLLDSLIETRGATHPWVCEHSYDRIGRALPSPAQPVAPSRPRI